MQNRTNRIVTNQYYYFLLLLVLLLIFSFSFCPVIVAVIVCFVFVLVVLVVVLLFCCRCVFTPVPADVTITRGATVWRRREGDTCFVYGGYSDIVTHSRTLRVRCTFDTNAALLQCRRKSTQDSRISENINPCHASLVQNKVIRASQPDLFRPTCTTLILDKYFAVYYNTDKSASGENVGEGCKQNNINNRRSEKDKYVP